MSSVETLRMKVEVGLRYCWHEGHDGQAGMPYGSPYQCLRCEADRALVVLSKIAAAAQDLSALYDDTLSPEHPVERLRAALTEDASDSERQDGSGV